MISAYDVACPVCELPIGANCRDELGRVLVEPHAERVELAMTEHFERRRSS